MTDRKSAVADCEIPLTVVSNSMQHLDDRRLPTLADSILIQQAGSPPKSGSPFDDVLRTDISKSLPTYPNPTQLLTASTLELTTGPPGHIESQATRPGK